MRKKDIKARAREASEEASRASLSIDQMWGLATLLKQWREYSNLRLRFVEGRRWKRKSLASIHENYRGLVRDFHAVDALRVSLLEELEQAYLIERLKGGKDAD